MKILGIDTTGQTASAALVEGDKLIAEFTMNYKLSHSQNIVPMIGDILARTETEKARIDCIACACGPGSFTGVLTLAVCSVGLLCKRFTEAIDTLDFRAYHALEAMGTPKLSCVRHAALPQLVPQFFSAWLYRFDVNIREASALGLAGAGGIGALLILALNQYAWHDVSTLALGMIALSWLVDLVSAFCRRRDA